MNKTLGIGIAGLGTVGQGFIKQLKSFKAGSKKAANIKVISVAVKNLRKKRNISTPSLPMTNNTMSLANNSEIDIVIELIGGSSGIAYKLVKKALSNGKHVITANKALLAMHGNELAKLAEKTNVSLNFEAAIAGGVPVLKAIRENLRFNSIRKVYGILNGTCNYILTKMENNEGSYQFVLNEAQKKGFAELDPTFDIQGIDAAHKITLLSCLAFDIPVNFKSTYVEGITKIDNYDFEYANELGYTIKLLSVATKSKDKIQQRVHTCFVKLSSEIAKVENETNAVVIEDSVIGRNMLIGPGAGAGPTGASVMSDLMDIVRETKNYPLGVSINKKKIMKIAKIEDLFFAYYLRISALDKAGVMAKISKALSKRKISIKSIIQKPSNKSSFAEIILITHKIKEALLISAIKQIKILPEVSSSVKFIRIEDSL